MKKNLSQSTLKAVPQYDFSDRKLDDHVPIEKLFWPEEYGRPYTHVVDIKENFDERAVGRIIVSMRPDGRFAIIDGNNRVEAARALGYRTMPCIVFIDLTTDEEAHLFSLYNNTRRTTALNRMKAALAAKDPAALSIERTLRQNGFEFAFSGPGVKKVACAKALSDVYANYGVETLANVARVLAAGFGADAKRVMTDQTVIGATAFWIRYGAAVKEARLVEVMNGSDPITLAAEGKKLGVAYGESSATGFGRALRTLYNKGLRTNQLPEWREYVFSPRGKEKLAIARAAQNGR